ncbi:MAG: hypothetical protein ACLFUB_03715 [Cyclobacteriaceae bacterium]
MKRAEREYFKHTSAEDKPEKKEKPAEEKESVEETRKKQRKHAGPEEQSPTRKGYG